MKRQLEGLSNSSTKLVPATRPNALGQRLNSQQQNGKSNYSRNFPMYNNRSQISSTQIMQAKKVPFSQNPSNLRASMATDSNESKLESQKSQATPQSQDMEDLCERTDDQVEYYHDYDSESDEHSS
jgi:hypothetical protein